MLYELGVISNEWKYIYIVCNFDIQAPILKRSKKPVKAKYYIITCSVFVVYYYYYYLIKKQIVTLKK